MDLRIDLEAKTVELHGVGDVGAVSPLYVRGDRIVHIEVDVRELARAEVSTERQNDDG